jgi:hypothetical protein
MQLHLDICTNPTSRDRQTDWFNIFSLEAIFMRAPPRMINVGSGRGVKSNPRYETVGKAEAGMPQRHHP